tara:strand:+ start:619 stop:822 length:204 start_codon:yes stop_codon:yes gene_type:complete
MGGREGINKGVNILMGKNRKFLAKVGNIVVSSRVRYNADSTCVSPIVQFNMCSSSLGGDIQVNYAKK